MLFVIAIFLFWQLCVYVWVQLGRRSLGGDVGYEWIFEDEEDEDNRKG